MCNITLAIRQLLLRNIGYTEETLQTLYFDFT